MKKRLLSLLMILLMTILVACGSDDSELEDPANNDEAAGESSIETDETSEDVTDETPETALETNANIIGTTVAIVEITDKLELDLVGLPTSYKDLPARYDGVPEIGMAMQPDLELIYSLQPDDILTTTNLTDMIAKYYDNTDLPVNYLDLDSIDSMYEEIQTLGETYDRKEQADVLVSEFEEKLAEIEAEIDGVEAPSVLILLGVPGSYLVVTENAYVGDLVKRAGGVNVIDEPELDRIAANTEVLQQTDPDVILRMAHGMPDTVVEMFEEEFATNDIWQHFSAVQEGRVYDLEEELFGTTASLAAVEALDHLVDILHEDRNE